MSFNGRTSASQAENEGSIPFTRSSFADELLFQDGLKEGSQIRLERIWTAKRPEHSEGEDHGRSESIPFTRSKACAYSLRYFQVSAPSNVLTLASAISAGDIILALTAMRLSSVFSVLS